MFQLYLDVSTILAIIMCAIAILILPLITFIQYYIHKKLLDPKYFNINYFSEEELAIFATISVFSISKPLVYVRAIILPSTMRKRFYNPILLYTI